MKNKEMIQLFDEDKKQNNTLEITVPAFFVDVDINMNRERNDLFNLSDSQSYQYIFNNEIIMNLRIVLPDTEIDKLRNIDIFNNCEEVKIIFKEKGEEQVNNKRQVVEVEYKRAIEFEDKDKKDVIL